MKGFSVGNFIHIPYARSPIHLLDGPWPLAAWARLMLCVNEGHEF